MEKKKFFKSAKFKHTSISVVFTVVFLAVIILVNFMLSALTDRFPSMNIDMTAQGLNSLSDTSEYVAESIAEETNIYIVGSEEDVRANLIYSNYGASYSQVANIADRLEESNENIKVSYIDPDLDPMFISSYPNESITVGTVVVETEKRYKVLQYSDLFLIEQSQTDGSISQYSLVDGALANALHLTNLETVPTISVATGHSEMLNSSVRESFDTLMKSNSFEVQEFNMLQEEIPEGTNILMISTPSTDYTAAELDKIREFLNSSTSDDPKSLFVTTHPTQTELPNLDAFLEEWGVKVADGVVLESDTGNMIINDASYLYAYANEDILDGYYPYLIVPYASPLELVFEENGDIVTSALLQSSDTSYITTDNTVAESPDTSTITLATLSQRTNVDATGAVSNSNVVVLGSSEYFFPDFLGTSTFANPLVLTDLFENLTATDDEMLSISTMPVQTNVIDIVATTNIVNILGIGVFTVGLPLAILTVGLVVFIRRRHL